MVRSALARCLIAVAAVAAPGAVAQGAESEMVGLVAVAIEPAVAQSLRLSDAQLRDLQDLADRREMQGMSRAMKFANLPRAERVAALAEFRGESERLGLAMLTPPQVEALRTVAAERDDPALRPVDPTGKRTQEAPPENAPSAPTAKPGTVETNAAEANAAEPDAAELAPAVAEPVAAAEVPAASDGKLSFNFRQQPWGDVIRWFADEADLSLVVDTPPPGTLTYRDSRRYEPAEALDVLNGVLLTKGFTLVRKDRMLLVIDLEQDAIPPNVVTDVPLAELSDRGEYELVRVLIDLGDIDATAAADSLLRLAGPQGAVVPLPEARLLQVTETAGRIRTMLAVIDAMRRAAAPVSAAESEVRSYPTGGADGAIVLKVLTAVLADSPTAQMEVDADAGTLIARATAAEHGVIRATLDRLATDGRRVEVVPVAKLDPLAAASIVNKLFDPTAGPDKKRDPNAPVVEADRESGSLLVRGTAAQVEQVRRLVQTLDTPDEDTPPGTGGPVRTLPITAAELQQAWPQVEALWPSLRANPLRAAGGGPVIPSFRPGAEVEREQQRGLDPLERVPPRRGGPNPIEGLLDGLLHESSSPPTGEREARARGVSARFASQPGSAPTADPQAEPIFVSPGPAGTVLVSRDGEALDALESLLATVLEASSSGARRYAVFYLKFADASTAATLLGAIFGDDSGESAGGLMGDLAGAALGGGDLLGGLLGGGESGAASFSSVSVDVVPDVRLNALYVYAAPSDLETVHQLLRVIDQPSGPDRVEATGVTRLIPCENTTASDVAGVVQTVFRDRIEGGTGGGGGQPSPQEVLRALAGGGQKGADDQEPERMAIGVDTRSNSLVVRSSKPLFEEVRALVEDLDRAGVERPVSTRVLSLHNTSSGALRQTLVSLLGDKAVIGTAAAAATTGTPPAPGVAPASNAPPQNEAPSPEETERRRREFRERIEGFRNLQRMFEGARQQQGGRGGGPPGGPAAGRGGRGGRGGGG